MQILVNGRFQTIECPTDLGSLLRKLGYSGDTFAVALNGDFVARTDYLHTEIGDGDTLDVVAPVVGG
ncbi:sulfur carrier protein ThiS [Microbulbifer magnicolonia]|uniref:sulfur carrier protein ThiS n=1 Tax=Microbulbifer magnicolonia TaxID=3109744 RepID=UPI002B4076FB|nr:sulfur carrier protein ThiS [Microbulbifer sp. GG15]